MKLGSKPDTFQTDGNSIRLDLPLVFFDLLYFPLILNVFARVALISYSV